VSDRQKRSGRRNASGTVNWDRLAASYPRQAWLEKSSLRTLVALIDPGAEERMLDVGTGTAELLQAMSRAPDRPNEAIGLDASRAMLGRARPLPPGWQLICARGEQLPFPDESFDIVTASYLLHVIDPDTRRLVVEECIRVLKPGGRFGAITITPPETKLGTVVTAPARWAAERYPSRLIGLRPLDPEPDLTRAGLIEPRRQRSFRGYPALCLVARKPG
jgi:ubiquinone/menaquinone biosynthesis C-methylase UbiE